MYEKNSNSLLLAAEATGATRGQYLALSKAPGLTILFYFCRIQPVTTARMTWVSFGRPDVMVI